MTAVRFRIGSVVGPVQGAGGFLTSLAVLLGEQRQAIEGRPLRSYEPRPGCVAVYPDYSAASNGEPVIVALVGVEIEQVSP